MDEEKVKVVNTAQKDGLHDGPFPSKIFSLLATTFSGGYDIPVVPHKAVAEVSKIGNL